MNVVSATPVEVFFIFPTERVRRVLRRTQMLRRGYLCQAATPVLGHPIWRHEGARVLDEVPQPLSDMERVPPPPAPGWPLDWPWPERCSNPVCPEASSGGYAFQADDPKLLLLDRVYEREGGGEPLVLSGPLPPGAVYDVAPWVPAGADGRSLVVVTPDGKPWYLDVAAPGGQTFWRSPRALLDAEQTAGDPWPWVLRGGVIRPA